MSGLSTGCRRIGDDVAGVAFLHDFCRVDEPLWTVHQSPIRVDCTLRSQGHVVWEVRLYRDGRFYSGRKFKRREQALRYADVLKRDLLSTGWKVEP